MCDAATLGRVLDARTAVDAGTTALWGPAQRQVRCLPPRSGRVGGGEVPGHAAPGEASHQEVQTHGFEVDPVGGLASATRLVLASVKSVFGSCGVFAAAFRSERSAAVARLAA